MEPFITEKQIFSISASQDTYVHTFTEGYVIEPTVIVNGDATPTITVTLTDATIVYPHTDGVTDELLIVLKHQ